MMDGAVEIERELILNYSNLFSFSKQNFNLEAK